MRWMMQKRFCRLTGTGKRFGRRRVIWSKAGYSQRERIERCSATAKGVWRTVYSCYNASWQAWCWKVLNERAEPPQSVQEEKRNRQAMAEDPPRQIPKRNEIELWTTNRPSIRWFRSRPAFFYIWCLQVQTSQTDKRFWIPQDYSIAKRTYKNWSILITILTTLIKQFDAEKLKFSEICICCNTASY